MRSTFNVSSQNCLEYELKYINFSDGSVQVQFTDNNEIVKDSISAIKITARILDSVGIIVLYQLTDLVRYYFGKNVSISLDLSYLPYARYDRRMTKYDAHSLKVFGQMINNLNFDEVIVDDLHSSVPEGIINNLYERYKQHDAFGHIMNHNNVGMYEYDYLIAPDNGAIKKTRAISEKFNIPMLIAAKRRDEASGFTVFDYLLLAGETTQDKTCIIPDDIIDGGATFVNLATELKLQYGFKSVDLFVTHGLFSKGKKLENVDNIFCFNDFSSILEKK